MAKYIQLAFVLLLRDICLQMKRRFPTLQSIKQADMLMNS